MRHRRVTVRVRREVGEIHPATSNNFTLTLFTHTIRGVGKLRVLILASLAVIAGQALIWLFWLAIAGAKTTAAGVGLVFIPLELLVVGAAALASIKLVTLRQERRKVDPGERR